MGDAASTSPAFGVGCPFERCSRVCAVLELDRRGNRNPTGGITAFPCPPPAPLPVLRTRGAAFIGRGQRHAGSIQPSAIDLPLSVWPSGSDWSPHRRSVESRVSRRQLGGRGSHNPHFEVR